MDKEVKIVLTEEIEKIMCENLSEKSEELEVEIKSCEDCPYYNNPWVRGATLHCCGYDFDDVITSRDINQVYDLCPLNHKLTTRKKYIKKYGIIHYKPEKNSYRNRDGSIHIVDFSYTTFESDGNNPDVDWRDVASFYYKSQKDADIIMELALEYYHRFNLDAEYVEKRCWG